MGVLWVAELGSMHKGDKSLAFELIRQAKEAGASIAKFQFGWNPDDKLRYVDGWAHDLKAWCDYFNVELMASIWSMDGLRTAQAVGMERYKIAHQKVDDTELLKAVLSDGKETFVSGMVGGGEFSKTRGIYCPPSYPTYPQDLKLPRNFNEHYGYSDHSHGIEACLLAVARGAQYIEKHFCLDKTDLSVRDTPFCATPGEFAELVRIGNGMWRLLHATS